MAVSQYSQSEIFSALDGMLHGKSAQLQSRQITVNRAVRDTLRDVDMHSMVRNTQISPNIFRDVFDYGAPSDLKQDKIIGIRKQVNRLSSEGWILVDEEDFDRYKEVSDYRIAISNDELVRTLKIDGLEGAVNATLHNCDSLTSNGTWAVVAGDASNLTLDSDNYISGAGALNFDTAAGATTAAIELTGATQVDLTDHDEISSIFVWVYIPDATDASGDAVTNFILRWGNDSSNYWSRTVTTNNEGATFYDGWNLLRFDWNGATETGTVAPATIDYMRLTITKPTGFDADTDWRVDNIVSRVGAIYNIIYYSKFGWQNSSGTYLEEASATTDLVNADTEEVDIILARAAELGSQELKEYDDVKYYAKQYKDGIQAYETNSPSQAMRIHRTYYDAPASGSSRGWKRTAR